MDDVLENIICSSNFNFIIMDYNKSESEEKMSMRFYEYQEASREIFTKIFGEEMLSKLDNTPKTPIDWNGLEVVDNSILVAGHNVKNRFTKSNLKHEEDNCMFNMFINTVYHYGYQVGRSTQSDRIKYLEESLKDYKEMSKMYREELKELRENVSN